MRVHTQLVNLAASFAIGSQSVPSAADMLPGDVARYRALRAMARELERCAVRFDLPAGRFEAVVTFGTADRIERLELQAPNGVSWAARWCIEGAFRRVFIAPVEVGNRIRVPFFLFRP